MKKIAVELDVCELGYIISRYYEQLDNLGCYEDECTCHEQSIICRRISEMEKLQDKLEEGSRDIK